MSRRRIAGVYSYEVTNASSTFSLTCFNVLAKVFDFISVIFKHVVYTSVDLHSSQKLSPQHGITTALFMIFLHIGQRYSLGMAFSVSPAAVDNPFDRFLVAASS